MSFLTTGRVKDRDKPFSSKVKEKDPKISCGEKKIKVGFYVVKSPVVDPSQGRDTFGTKKTLNTGSLVYSL